MSNIFYRFRSLDYLLGKYKELENQEIYFASPEKLNDPMEGFKNLVFRGDEIVWRNFFKHYLLCLEQVISLYKFPEEEYHTITIDDIPVYKEFNDLPTLEYKKLLELIWKNFFDICGNFIDKISARTTLIRKDELSLYLTSMHLIAVQSIEKNYIEFNLLDERKVEFHFIQKSYWNYQK